MPLNERRKGVLRLVPRELPQQIQIIAGHLTNLSPPATEIRQEKVLALLLFLAYLRLSTLQRSCRRVLRHEALSYYPPSARHRPRRRLLWDRFPVPRKANFSRTSLFLMRRHSPGLL